MSPLRQGKFKEVLYFYRFRIDCSLVFPAATFQPIEPRRSSSLSKNSRDTRKQLNLILFCDINLLKTLYDYQRASSITEVSKCLWLVPVTESVPLCNLQGGLLRFISLMCNTRYSVKDMIKVQCFLNKGFLATPFSAMMDESHDDYQKMLIRLRKEKGSDGPQAATVMDRVLAENADQPMIYTSTIRHANEIVAKSPLPEKSTKIPEAKKTSVFFDARVGDNSYGVTYLGARGKGPVLMEKVVKHKPTDRPLNNFYVGNLAAYEFLFFPSIMREKLRSMATAQPVGKNKLESTQESAWRSGRLNEGTLPRRSPENKEDILNWEGDKDEEALDMPNTVTLTFMHIHTTIHCREDLVFAKKTSVLIGGHKGKKGSTVRTDFNHHGTYKRASPATSAKGTFVFMNWEAPKKHFVKTTDSYGLGFRPKQGAKPRVPRYDPTSPSRANKKGSLMDAYRSPGPL
eukprot:jgi/Bigna1/77220/fgenesh1_pg.46_\